MGSKYVASSLSLAGSDRVAVVTGPNMGGKSTFIRAVGVCALLAHVGSFVPADRAVIPLYDRLLVRMGATDSCLRGVSTFLVEMQVQ
mgnify:FL=1